MAKLTTRQIGRCGELLVQYVLLKHGIESAPLTTDVGIDLVAYPGIGGKPLTIQVKTSSHLGKSNDKWILWQIPDDCPADYVAAVDLIRDKFWLIHTEVFRNKARSTTNGQKRLWWPLPECEYKGAKVREEDFKEYEMNTAIRRAFGINDQFIC